MENTEKEIETSSLRHRITEARNIFDVGKRHIRPGLFHRADIYVWMVWWTQCT